MFLKKHKQSSMRMSAVLRTDDNESCDLNNFKPN